MASERGEDTGLYKVGYLLSARVNRPDAQASSLECPVDYIGAQQQTVQSSYQSAGSISVSGMYSSPGDICVTAVRSPIVRVELDKSSFPAIGWTAYSSYTGGPASGGSFDLSYFVYESSTYYTYHWNVTVNGTNLPSVPGVVSDQIIYVNDKQLNAQTYYQGR